MGTQVKLISPAMIDGAQVSPPTVVTVPAHRAAAMIRGGVAVPAPKRTGDDAAHAAADAAHAAVKAADAATVAAANATAHAATVADKAKATQAGETSTPAGAKAAAAKAKK